MPGGGEATTALPELVMVDAMLAHIRALGSGEVMLGDFTAAMGQRGFGFCLIVFGVLAILLPGVGSLMGAPVMLFAAQMTWGSTRPWMPGWLARRRMPAERAARALERARPWLRRLEIFAKPRQTWLTRGLSARAIGIACSVMGFIILLPGPLTNAPTGTTCIIFGFALAERDGLLAGIGFVASLIATVLGTSGFLLLAALVWAWWS